MAKLKPLLPSLRERKRYVVFEVISKNPIKYAKSLAKAIEQSMLSLAGSLGLSRAGLIFLNDKYDTRTQRGVVRVSHTSVDELKCALALTQSVDREAVIIRSVGVSGILKKALSKYHAE